VPFFFCKFMRKLKHQFMRQIVDRAHKTCQRLSPSLLLASYQFVGRFESRKMPVTMAAGLPHFSTGWTRCWGRDTFISFKGGLLLPGMFREARETILQFAGEFRMGLIPNLLNFGDNPRYNCRDAVWWFVKAVADYLEFTQDWPLLQQTLPGHPPHGELALASILHQVFEAHAQGIQFREPRAGPQLDSNMDENGFNISLRLNEETGFIMGGNSSNCLTWMDKMGSSAKAGNRGWPATSRNGCPVELVGLLHHCLARMIALHQAGRLPFDSVQLKSGERLAFADWKARI
jgi:glycogen debranching enzyme